MRLGDCANLAQDEPAVAQSLAPMRQTAGVDVERALRIATLNASMGEGADAPRSRDIRPEETFGEPVLSGQDRKGGPRVIQCSM